MNRILAVNYRMCEVRMNILIQSDGPSIFEACAGTHVFQHYLELAVAVAAAVSRASRAST